MAYLKLVFDELEIAHLSEDGQYLCANKGVPQYRTDYLDFVCTDQEGKLIRPNFVTEHFDWLLTKYGLKHIRFHDLRHPYVKHTTKNIIPKSRKTQTTNLSADSLGFLFLLFILRLCP